MVYFMSSHIWGSYEIQVLNAWTHLRITTFRFAYRPTEDVWTHLIKMTRTKGDFHPFARPQNNSETFEHTGGGHRSFIGRLAWVCVCAYACVFDPFALSRVVEETASHDVRPSERRCAP